MPLMPAVASGVPGQIQIEPVMFDLHAGMDSAQQTIHVINNKDKAVILDVEICNWTLNGDGRLMVEPPNNEPLAGWIDFPEKIITIPAAQQKSVQFSIHPPKDVLPGEYRAIIYFQEHKPEKKNDLVEVTFRLGAGVYFQIGEARRRSVIESISFDDDSGGIVMVIKNDGNIHTSFHGDYSVWDKGSFPGFKSMQKSISLPHEAERPKGFIMSGSMNLTPVLPGTRSSILTSLHIPLNAEKFEIAIVGTIDGKKIEKHLK